MVLRSGNIVSNSVITLPGDHIIRYINIVHLRLISCAKYTLIKIVNKIKFSQI